MKITERVREVLKIVKEKDLTFEKLLVCFDISGPMAPVTTASLEPYPHIRKPISELTKIPCVVLSTLSGWDLTSQREFKERLSIDSFNLIGELGSVYQLDGRLYELNPISKKIHYEMKTKIYQSAAENELKIAIQGNMSSRVACIYTEADGPERGNLRNHPLVKKTNVSTLEIFNAIRKRKSFEYRDNKIAFEATQENIREIDFVISRIFPFQSVRLKQLREDKIALWRDHNDRLNFTFDDMIDFIKSAVPKGWDIDPNPDYCADLIYIRDGKKINKEMAANELAKKKFKSDNYTIIHVGDKKSDVLYGQNTLFFPQRNTDAHKFCQTNRIPHVPVEDAGDYSLLVKKVILSMRQ